MRDVAIAIVLAGIVAVVLLGTDGYRTLLRDALSDKSIGESLLANARAVPQMLSLWVRPWALTVDHEFDQRLHLGASIAGLALLLTAAGVAFALRRQRPMLALAIAWPLIALLPTNSILAKPDLVTEKPLYLAWVGVSIALGAAVPALLSITASRMAKRVFLGAAGLLLCALIAASAWRVSVWRDPVALWTDAIAKAPHKSRCWNNLGMAYLAAQRELDAVTAFERAVFLDPRNKSRSAESRYCARALYHSTLLKGCPISTTSPTRGVTTCACSASAARSVRRIGSSHA